MLNLANSFIQKRECAAGCLQLATC